MKKFHDVLRILSSVLLGALVREFDDLVSSLQQLFAKESLNISDEKFARATAIVLLVLFVRNIHSSSRYDEVAGNGFSPGYERNYFGRVLTFCLALAGLFLGPSLVGHHLAKHTAGISEATFGTILFLPYVIYAFWDLLLWIFQTSWNGSCLEKVAYRWIVLDCIGLLIVLAFVYAIVWSRSSGNTEFTAMCFLIVSAVLIVGDYYLNRDFYFPPSFSEASGEDPEQKRAAHA